MSVAADKKNLRVLYDGEEVYSADKVPIVVNSFKVFGETLRVEKANETKTAARSLLLPGNAA